MRRLFLPKSLLPQQHKNKKEENKPSCAWETKPVAKASVQDEWAKELCGFNSKSLTAFQQVHNES